MKKFTTLLILMAIILVGCVSVPDESLLDSSMAIQKGFIVEKQKKAMQNDIVCEGKFHPNALRLTQIPFTNLVPSWWKGNIIVKKSKKKDVKISYLNTRGHISGKSAEMNFIKVKGFDDTYSFPEMTIREPMFSTIVKKDLPYTFTEFRLDGEEFLLLMTAMNEPLIKTQYASTTLFDLWRYKNQVFRIVGKNDGEIYAEFTKNAYVIVHTPATASIEELCYAIGVFSVIQKATDRKN